MRNQSMRCRTVLVLLVAGLTIGCHEYFQLTRQTATFADMQNISRELFDSCHETGTLSEEVASRIASQYNNGKDRWGNPFLFHYRDHPACSFILVSLGSDGIIDVDDITIYFEKRREDIVGHLDRDIVFRDGMWITRASAK